MTHLRTALKSNASPIHGALALLLAGLVPAQDLALDKSGGAVGGLLTLRAQGQPHEPCLFLFHFREQVTPIPALGITLAIPDTFAGSSFALPGFFTATNANGAAAASLLLPNDPSLEHVVVSLQAIAGNGPFRASNLARVTPQLPGTFQPTLRQPALPIAGGTAAAAADGALLFVGGSGPVAQRYDSRTEEWQAAGVTFGVGLLSQSTDLADGRILFTGGLDLMTGQPTGAAAVYDPIARTTTTLAMASPRAGHGASRLGNGKVLVTGGIAAVDLQNPLAMLGSILATTEIFDPATNAFAPGPNLLEARALHTSTTLTNGHVLIAGGLTLLPIVNLPTVSATAYKFNPATNSFGLPAVFAGARFLHSASPLGNGKVLLAGGLTLDLAGFLQSGRIQDLVVGTRTDCQVYSPSLFGFGTFATVDGLQQGRAGAAIAPLPNGGALVAGGFTVTIDAGNGTFELAATATADRFTQGPNTLQPTGSMAAPRLFPTTVPLPDGTVMVVGGGPANAEVYQN